MPEGKTWKLADVWTFSKWKIESWYFIDDGPDTLHFSIHHTCNISSKLIDSIFYNNLEDFLGHVCSCGDRFPKLLYTQFHKHVS